MRRLAAFGLLVGAASCVIIIEPAIDGPVPTPLPLTCNPVSEAPTVHVYFATRIERSTVNLADRYSAVMQDVALGLAAIGANLTIGVMVRQDEAPVDQPLLAAWGCNLDSPEQLLPADVIRYYAQRTESEPAELGCAIDPLVELGANLPDAVTQYPLELPGTSGHSVFGGGAPDLVLVVHMDALGRKTGFDEPGCAQASDAMSADEDGAARWLAYAGAIPHDRIVHWFFTTEELVSREAFVAACKQVDGFPSSVLDTLEESKKALYGPLASAVSDRGGSVAALPMCRMLVQTEERKFLKDGLGDIAGKLGLELDEERLENVLNGGIPELLGPESDNLAEGALGGASGG